MKRNERFDNKFSLLLSEGKQILSASGWNGREYHHFPSDIDYQRWRIEALNLIEKVCGRKSVHFELMQGYALDNGKSTNSYYMKDCFGIFEGAYKDYNDGMLSDIKSLVRADLLDDFLEQAEFLLNGGYHIAASSVTGAVLEDTLRKVCLRYSLNIPEKTNINNLNSELSKANVYDKLVNKEITAKADIRNNADHGHFDKVRHADVEDMIRWVRRFVSDFLE